MKAYGSFARVYDLFMDNVPYEEWSVYLIGLLKEYGIDDKTVLDLGCGTGKMTRLLASAGYDMIGIDNSEEMLEEARACEMGSEPGGLCSNILYLYQDMRRIELLGCVQAVISICDSINYILSEEDLIEVFRGVRRYLEPGGVFIFDMNTTYKYKELLGETTIAEAREEGCFIWDNYYDEETRMNEYDLTLFIQEEGSLYRRYEETHCQRAYEEQTIRRLLASAGLKTVAVYDAFTREPPRADSERIYVIARVGGEQTAGK